MIAIPKLMIHTNPEKEKQYYYKCYAVFIKSNQSVQSIGVVDLFVDLFVSPSISINLFFTAWKWKKF